MKLLVTGCNGFVAGSVIAAALDKWQVHGIARSATGSPPTDWEFHNLDLQDLPALEGLLTKLRPTVVVHTAALANIDYCEENQQVAERVNVGITESIAGFCSRAGIKMVFCSTDSVFDGLSGHYREVEQPVPLNFYALTKVKAEQIVLTASPQNMVARLSLVMGLPVLGRGNSFLADTLEKWKEGAGTKFPTNEIRTPIDIFTAGRALVEIAGNSLGGILHLSGNTAISRYEMAKRIAGKMGFPLSLIEGINSNVLPGRAPRPDNASLDNGLARQQLQTSMLSLDEGIDLMLNENKAHFYERNKI